MFAVRDPWGIRPAFYCRNEELVAVASERAVLQTSFNLDYSDVSELLPGQALIVHKNGDIAMEQILPAAHLSACSFERIYFSRGSDADIYQERKRLGWQLAKPVLEVIGNDVDNTVFSYIPNTAEVAYYGLLEGLRSPHCEVRAEKVVWKDIKLRTFITDNAERNDLAAHVYDISYGSVRRQQDNLVIIDDSIVRGTTLRESIFKILDRLHPKKIVMVSSAPQIRYPDYYGIDMSHLEELCAFRAAVALLRDRGMQQLITDVYRACKEQPLAENHVQKIYKPFSVEEINDKIVEMLRPEGMETPVQLVFQSIEGLHKACPGHTGDWYFTGDYPTPGGVRLCNEAFVNYVEYEKD
jgi:amidophosphoribosyltransferase